MARTEARKLHPPPTTAQAHGLHRPATLRPEWPGQDRFRRVLGWERPPEAMSGLLLSEPDADPVLAQDPPAEGPRADDPRADDRPAIEVPDRQVSLVTDLPATPPKPLVPAVEDQATERRQPEVNVQPPVPQRVDARGEGMPQDRQPSGSQGGEQSAAPVDATAPLPAWLMESARQVEWLCQRADPSFRSFSVTLPLDPEVLPDSELSVALSPCALTLRFRTGSTQSANLISRHRARLQGLLQGLPSLPSEIDIDLE